MKIISKCYYKAYLGLKTSLRVKKKRLKQKAFEDVCLLKLGGCQGCQKVDEIDRENKLCQVRFYMYVLKAPTTTFQVIFCNKLPTQIYFSCPNAKRKMKFLKVCIDL